MSTDRERYARIVAQSDQLQAIMCDETSAGANAATALAVAIADLWVELLTAGVDVDVANGSIGGIVTTTVGSLSVALERAQREGR